MNWIPLTLSIGCGIYLLLTYLFIGMRFSISDTHYGWIEKEKMKWPFPLLLSFISVMLFIFVIYIEWKFTDYKIPMPGKALFICSGFCAFGIGCAAYFRDGWFVNFSHNLFSVALILLCFLAFSFTVNWYGIIFYAAVVGILVLTGVSNRTYWIETAAIITLIYLMQHYITQLELGLL